MENDSICIPIQSIWTNHSTTSVLTAARITFLSVLTSVSSVGIFGNLTVILAFLIDRNIREMPFNVYILFLAVTDLFIVSSTCAFYYSLFWIDDTINFSHHLVLASIFHGISTFGYIANSFVVVLMSYDRYLLVTCAIKHVQTQTVKRILTKVLLTCILGALYNYVALIVITVIISADCFQTLTHVSPSHFVVSILYVVFDTLLPLSLLIGLNLLVYWKLQIREKAFRPNFRSGTEYSVTHSTSHKDTTDIRTQRTNRQSHLHYINNYKEPEGFGSIKTGMNVTDTCSTSSISLGSVEDATIVAGGKTTPYHCDKSTVVVSMRETASAPSQKSSPVDPNPHKTPVKQSFSGLRAITPKGKSSNVKAARWLFMYVLIYLTFHFPLVVHSVLISFDVELSIYAEFAAQCFLIAGCAINPFLYAARSKRYKRKLGTVCPCSTGLLK